MQASLTPFIVQQAFTRDQGCIFSKHIQDGNTYPKEVTWIFPPFLGYEVSMQLLYNMNSSSEICYLLISYQAI
jgi:hypothetical protein